MRLARGATHERRGAPRSLLHARARRRRALLTLVPLLWMVSASLMPAGRGEHVPAAASCRASVTFEHYVALFTRLDLARALRQQRAGLGRRDAACSVLINGMAGYAFAKLRFAGRDRVFRALLAALVIPAQVGMLPLFLLLKSMGLVNTLVGVMIPGLASVFGIFLVRQYALGDPRRPARRRAASTARASGGSSARSSLPVLPPILVTLAAFTFLSMWNDFLWPLIVLSDDAQVHAAGRAREPGRRARAGHRADDGRRGGHGAAGAARVPALQRAYVRGIMAGSVKG